MSLETLFEAGDEECQRCGVMQGLYQRQNTQFADEALNWVVLCPDCAKLNEESGNEILAQQAKQIIQE